MSWSTDRIRVDQVSSDLMKRNLLVLAAIATTTAIAATTAPVQPVQEPRAVKSVQFSVFWGLIKFNSGQLPEECKDRCNAGREDHSEKGSRRSFLGGAVQWERSGPDSRSCD